MRAAAAIYFAWFERPGFTDCGRTRFVHRLEGAASAAPHKSIPFIIPGGLQPAWNLLSRIPTEFFCSLFGPEIRDRDYVIASNFSFGCMHTGQRAKVSSSHV